jgi:hypothetical protein
VQNLSRHQSLPVSTVRQDYRRHRMHEPDRMYLNPSQIVFVETVGTNSKVAQLIAQAPH